MLIIQCRKAELFWLLFGWSRCVCHSVQVASDVGADAFIFLVVGQSRFPVHVLLVLLDRRVFEALKDSLSIAKGAVLGAIRVEVMCRWSCCRTSKHLGRLSCGQFRSQRSATLCVHEHLWGGLPLDPLPVLDEV